MKLASNPSLTPAIPELIAGPSPDAIKKNCLARFALAASYVTRLPLAKLPADHDSAHMRGLSKYLPVVGLLVGFLLCLVCWLTMTMSVHHLLSGALVTVAWLLITGGIHFDGLMDTADGVFSHRDRQRMLAIMADSRVGNFGAMTGWCVLLLKFTALASLPPQAVLPVLLVVPAWARWCEAYAIGAFPYLRQSGMGKIWHESTSFPGDVVLSCWLPLLLTFALAQNELPVAALASMFTVVAGLCSSYWINGILKGQTGDTYGAAVELAETGGLLAIALLINLPVQ